jgi:RND family efflux transporter MFP subunit
VVDWSIREGEAVSPGVPVGILVDLDRFHTDVFIDELDIGRVGVGQPVNLELDAFPGEQLLGQVGYIEAIGTAAQGLVTYKVTIDVGNPGMPVKPDMTASVSIVVAEKEDVLLVPTRALKRDKQGKYVEILEGTVLIRAAVEVGLSDETHTEVLSGLEEGDAVVVKKPRSGTLPFQGG